MIWYFDTLDMSKPLVFLCGPFFDGTPEDRRSVLKKYIEDNWYKNEEDGSYIHGIPLIVDLFFNEERIKGTQLKTNLLEEIISNVSYKTYIFLDSVSTGYELGQFTNYSYGNNNTEVFVDNEYENRPSNKIGGYINLSFNNRFIRYDCEYKKVENERYIFFRKNDGKIIIPKTILEQLNLDNPINNLYNPIHKISFTQQRSKIMDDGVFIYTFIDGLFTIESSLKNLFYFVSMVYRSHSHMVDYQKLPSSVEERNFKDFVNKVKSELMSSFISISKDRHIIRELVKPNSEYRLMCGVIDVNLLIYHMLFLSILYVAYKGGKKEYLTAESSKIRFSINHKDDFDAFGIVDSDLYKNLTKIKNDYYGLAITKKVLYKRGKRRKIVCYKNNYHGVLLRQFHEEVNSKLLSLLPSSELSFAYKDNLSTKDCIKKHEGNTFFYKIDIEKYFESIRFSRISYLINKYLTWRVNVVKINKYFLLSNKSKKLISSILFHLFHKYTLPIGFSSSPKLSDFYLYDIDEEMKKRTSITYTRYADDILISSNNKNYLEEAIVFLRTKLSQYCLRVNERKTIYKELLHDNDSIKFLGINMVRRKGGVVTYTISNSYLVETSKMIQEYSFNLKDEKLLIKIEGRVSYIRYISKDSFNKLSRLVSKKICNIDKNKNYFTKKCKNFFTTNQSSILINPSSYNSFH